MSVYYLTFDLQRDLSRETRQAGLTIEQLGAITDLIQSEVPSVLSVVTSVVCCPSLFGLPLVVCRLSRLLCLSVVIHYLSSSMSVGFCYLLCLFRWIYCIVYFMSVIACLMPVTSSLVPCVILLLLSPAYSGLPYWLDFFLFKRLATAHVVIFRLRAEVLVE